MEPLVESRAIASDSGQLRRVVFGGSLAVSLALGAVVVASSMGRSDADTIGEPDLAPPTASIAPAIENVPTETDLLSTERVPSATALIEPASPAIVSPEIVSPEIVSPEIVSNSTPALASDSVPATIATDAGAGEGVEPDAAPLPDETGSRVPAAEVEESSGVVRSGQIFLTGAVPTVESGERIAALAATILGPENVINNYVIDPRASDPNLGNLTVEDTINFATDSTDILPGSETLLNQGLALLTIRPAMTVTIVGHTDSRGTDLANQELSLGRAEMVMQWFVDRGISADRFTVVGAGSSEPLADNETAEGRRTNRRIQFFLENILV
jgi:outer membrane protein OmpA-like peptidoglycan-associated protein